VTRAEILRVWSGRSRQAGGSQPQRARLRAHSNRPETAARGLAPRGLGMYATILARRSRGEIDLIEEIARIYGLDKFPPRLLQLAKVRRACRITKLKTRLRERLIGLGYREILTIRTSRKK